MSPTKVLTLYVVAKALRDMLTVFEAGSINGAQREAMQRVRMVMGDLDRIPCLHERTAYETIKDKDNILVCQDCREIVE